MNDQYDRKRGMVSMLLKMLKQHASSEVENGLKRPEGGGDMHGIQAERVLDEAHDMDHPTSEHDVLTHELNQGGMAYSKGGVVEDVNAEKYDRAPIPEMPMESGEGHPDKEGSAHEEATESEEEREAEGDVEPMHSPFETFLKKKKK